MYWVRVYQYLNKINNLNIKIQFNKVTNKPNKVN